MVGCVSLLLGPAPSPLLWKSRCWSACFGSTWPWTGFAPSFFSPFVGFPVLAGVVLDPAPAGLACDTLSVFGDGGVVGRRSQPAASASSTAMPSVKAFIESPLFNVRRLLQLLYPEHHLAEVAVRTHVCLGCVGIGQREHPVD